MTKFYDETAPDVICEHCNEEATGECTCFKCQSCFRCHECYGNSHDLEFCDECVAEGVLDDEFDEE